MTEDYQGRVRQFCGGSVIDEYHVLTAAHCVASYTESDVRRLRVQLGVHDIKNTPSKSTHKVDRIIRHIDFSQRTLVSQAIYSRFLHIPKMPSIIFFKSIWIHNTVILV